MPGLCQRQRGCPFMMPCPLFHCSASSPSDHTPGSCSDSPPALRQDLALHSESFGSCLPAFPTPQLLALLIPCAGTPHGQGQVVLFPAYNLPPTLLALAAHLRPCLRHPLPHGAWGTGEDHHSPSSWADRIKLAYHFLVLQNCSAEKRKQP